MVIKNDVATSQKLVTADELLQHPEWGRCELIEGKVNFMSPAGAQHGDIGGEVFGLIWTYVRQKKLGRVFAAETGFMISRNPDTVRAPDVMFLSQARIPAGGIPKEYLPVVPDLTVEVVSPSDTFSDVSEKAEAYVNAGVKLVWVVDPQTRQAFVFKPGKVLQKVGTTDALSGEDVLPGFSLPLAELFD